MPSVTKIKLRGYHVDAFNHLNHGRYVELLEEARWAYFDDHPDVAEQLHNNNVAHAVVNLNINYRRGATVGDVIRIETRIAGAGKTSLTMEQKVYLDDSDTLLADAEITNVFFKIDDGQPIPVRSDIFHLWTELQEILAMK